MKVLVQRVKWAQVQINQEVVGKIDRGLLLLLGVEKGDSYQNADKLINKVLAYRIFADEAGKMNLSVQEVGGGLLIVSQFTLVADTAKGLRPSFSSAAPPDEGNRLYQYWLEEMEKRHSTVQAGVFGADMQVSLLNDGPVTFMLEA